MADKSPESKTMNTPTISASATSTPVRIRDCGVYWHVTINNPPVNATSTAVRQGLTDALVKCVDDGIKKAVILTCEGRSFIAGGDITEFDAAPQEPHLPDVCNAIEASPLPWIAVMHGHVLGGGLEIAMSAAYRIADRSTKFGMTEVKLGLIPGAGGSQRLPRLIGLDAAIPILTTGAMITAEAFQKLGGIDHISETVASHDDKGLSVAEDFLNTLSANTLLARPEAVSTRMIKVNDVEMMTRVEVELKAASKGDLSPLANLDALQLALDTDFTEGQAEERKRHLEMRDSALSRGLRHAFLAERQVNRPALIRGAKAKIIKTVAVVGGGLMGAGIAFSAMMTGYNVRLIERDQNAVASAKARISGMADGAVKRRKMTAEDAETMIANAILSDDYSVAADADIAVEAVFEDLKVKKDVFIKLEGIMRGDAIFASNTSYLDPHKIMDGISHQERMLGLHFFSPAHIMKLVEVITLSETDRDVLAAGFSFAKSLGKTGVLSRVCDGFIGNRMLAAYRRQADYLLMDGATPTQVDRAMRGFGMNMGPYEMQDMAGLQIAWANRKRLASTRPIEERYVRIGDELCDRGWFGQKSGLGWYRYEDGNRTPLPSPDVDALILSHAQEDGITRREFNDEEIQLRLMAVMVNEGALIVEEGIAERDADVDIVKLLGYGFPRWRGGPMCFANEIGWQRMAAIMADVDAQSPNSWTFAKRLSQPI